MLYVLVMKDLPLPSRTIHSDFGSFSVYEKENHVHKFKMNILKCCLYDDSPNTYGYFKSPCSYKKAVSFDMSFIFLSDIGLIILGEISVFKCVHDIPCPDLPILSLTLYGTIGKLLIPHWRFDQCCL